MLIRETALVLCAALALMLAPAGMSPAEDADNADDDQDQDQENQAPPDNGWPQTVLGSDCEVTIYQPQIDSWQDNILSARAAVGVKTVSTGRQTYGVISFTARTDIDRDAGVVTFNDIRINKVNFPRADSERTDYKPIIESSIPGWPGRMALSRLQADLAITKAEMNVQRAPVRNDPPRIIYSPVQAVLVSIDGTPVLRNTVNPQFVRIVNTRALMILDKSSGSYYLYLSDHWEKAQAVEGPWSRAAAAPAGLDAVKDDAAKSGLVDLLDQKDKDVAVESPAQLAVYVSTVPAELLIVKGQPDLQPIDGTQILYVKNSDNSIFLYIPDKTFYALISGRWFKTATLEKGPWQFVPGPSLPADFSKIPENHPEGSVLASIPDTAQAKEAAISNSIPQTATIARSQASADITYDGDPKFAPIDGTPLSYAVNTATPVIRVSDAGYYSVQNGVWFKSPSPGGPWIVADSVPAVIYTIPPSNKLYYVTYVKVYGSTQDDVYVGYTPGYYGSYIGTDNTVVYGTGYSYTPWIGGYWYGPPVTWGVGVCYGWYGWGWGWGWRYAWGWHPYYYPWWGPYYGWRGGWYGGYHGWGYWHPNAYNQWNRGVVVNNYRGMGNRQGYLGQGQGRNWQDNNHFAGRDGNVYRKNSGGNWEKHNGGDGWSRGWKGGEHERNLNNYNKARSLGNNPGRYKSKGGGGHKSGGGGGGRRR